MLRNKIMNQRIAKITIPVLIPVIVLFVLNQVYITSNKVTKPEILTVQQPYLPWWEKENCIEEFSESAILGRKYLAETIREMKEEINGLESNLSFLNSFKLGKNYNSKTPEKLNTSDVLFYSKWKSAFAVNHTCGWRSYNWGPNQKVISFSLYGKNPEYYMHLDDLLSRIQVLYPGWVVRLYTDAKDVHKFTCPLTQKFDNFHICDVKSMPPPFNDVSKVHPGLWRAMPMYDPYVDVVIVRDTDAVMLEREVDAVNEWLSSGKTLHVMRDHPLENTEILGGMYGVHVTEKKREKIKYVLMGMLEKSLSSSHKDHDQKVLAVTLWPAFKTDMIAHDAYLCRRFPNTQPWPSQRKNGKFVGNANYRIKYQNTTLKQACPTECRPPQHQDWVYC